MPVVVLDMKILSSRPKKDIFFILNVFLRIKEICILEKTMLNSKIKNNFGSSLQSLKKFYLLLITNKIW